MTNNNTYTNEKATKDFETYKEELEILNAEMKEIASNYTMTMYSEEAEEKAEEEAKNIQDKAYKLINEVEEQEHITDEQFYELEAIKDDMMSIDRVTQKVYDNMLEWTRLTNTDRSYYMFED